MTIYTGLQVSDKSTHICVVDADGAVLRYDVVASDPDALTNWFYRHCPDLRQVVLEAGKLSTFLYNGLKERDVPVVCICARNAKGVLATRFNKSDVHDAEGLAPLERTGWFKRVQGPKTRPDCSGPQTGCVASFALAERDRVSLSMIPAIFSQSALPGRSRPDCKG